VDVSQINGIQQSIEIGQINQTSVLSFNVGFVFLGMQGSKDGSHLLLTATTGARAYIPRKIFRIFTVMEKRHIIMCAIMMGRRYNCLESQRYKLKSVVGEYEWSTIHFESKYSLAFSSHI
jgi:hypothetical protein